MVGFGFAGYLMGSTWELLMRTFPEHKGLRLALSDGGDR